MHKGIILKSYKFKHKFLILDYDLGKIECTTLYENAPVRFKAGFYLSYTLLLNRFLYTLSNASISNAPNCLSYPDLLFFYHIIELCEFFIPFNVEAKAIFGLMDVLYENPKAIKGNLWKMIFISKFFYLLSIYPPNMHKFDNEVLDIISLPLDSNFDYVVGNGVKEANLLLYNWLLRCINVHTNANRMMTFKFLKELGLHE